MKKIDLGQTISVFANIGVIVGIVFLAVEISQNNEALKTQARLERESVRRNSYERWLQNPDLIRAEVKVQADEPLSPEEELLLWHLNAAIFNDTYMIYQQVQDGLLEESAIPVASWRQGFHLFNPRMKEAWPYNSPGFPPDFVRWYEDNIIAAGPIE